jgi:hypothetical protein
MATALAGGQNVRTRISQLKMVQWGHPPMLEKRQTLEIARGPAKVILVWCAVNAPWGGERSSLMHG